MAILAPYDKGIPQTWATQLTANDSAAKHPLGTFRYENGGRVFVYCRAAEALTIGQAVKQVMTDVLADNAIQTDIGTAGDFGLSTNDNGFVFDTVGSNLPAMATTANIAQGFYATVNTNNVTRQGDTYRIASHSTTRVYLDRNLDNVLVNNDVVLIWSPWRVNLVTAITQSVVGVAMGTVTSGNYFWAQCKGLNPQCSFRLVTNTTHFVLAESGDLATVVGPSTTSGALGQLSTTTTAATVAQLNALAKACGTLACPIGNGTSTAATRLVPVFLNCSAGGLA